MAWRKPANLNEWFGILLRHKKKFFFPAVIVMIGFIWASQWMPREFRADAKFERRSESTVSARDGVLGEQYGNVRGMLSHDFRGRASVEQLIRDLKLNEGIPTDRDGQYTKDGRIQYEQLISDVTDSIVVRHQSPTTQIDVVSISYSDRKRELVDKVVNRLMDNYITKVAEDITRRLTGQKDFFEKEAKRYKVRFGEAESALLRQKLAAGDLDPEDPVGANKKLEDLRAKRDDARASFEREKGEIEKLLKWEKDQPEFLKKKKAIENPELLSLKDQLKKMKEALEINLYEYRRTEAHPAVIDLRRRIRDKQRELDNFEGTDKIQYEEEPNVEKIAAQAKIQEKAGALEALDKQIKKLDADVERYEVLSRNFFQEREKYLKLSRERDDANDQLKFWDENLRRTQTALQLEAGAHGMRLTILQRATEAGKPSSPSLMKILGMAVLAGLGAGGLMIVLAELMDHSYRTVEQAVDEIKLPVLGAVNEIVSPTMAMRRKILSWGVFPLVTMVLVLMLGIVFYITYLSLQSPHRFEDLKKDPVSFIKQAVGGI